MGKVKEYMLDLAQKLDKDFDEVTNEDMERDFANKVWSNWDSTEEELESCKKFLDTKPYKDVAFYDAEEGTPKFKVGDVMCDGNGIHYLIVK